MATYTITISPAADAAYAAQTNFINNRAAAAFTQAQNTVDAENAAIDAANAANGTNTPHVPNPPPAVVLTETQVIQQDLEWAAQGHAQSLLGQKKAEIAAALDGATPAQRQQIYNQIATITGTTIS